MEDSLTIEELTETYKKIIDSKLDNMDFMASLQGIDLKTPRVDNNESTKKQESFNDRLRAKMDSQKERSAASGVPTKFADGVGYRVIGG